MTKNRHHPIVFLLLSAVLIASTAEAGRLYRWVDSEGQVHYGDKIPPEYVKNRHTQLDQQGVTVKQVQAAKSKEELKKEAELARLREEKQRLIDEQRAADRVLLRTFRSEDDIIMARDGKLASIDVSIQVTRSNIRRLKDVLNDLHERAGRLERAGKSVSQAHVKDIEQTKRSLNTAYNSILDKEKTKEGIRAAFAQDQERFRELKHLENGSSPSSIDSAEKNPQEELENIFICTDSAQCTLAWNRATNFMKAHANTPVQMRGDNIIMTAPPQEDQDISITIARLTPSADQPTRLFMDLQCKDSPIGREFCQSEKVSKIRASFLPAIDPNYKRKPALATK